MKIRSGFVSNSSTSSFCVFGAVVTQSFLETLLKNPDKEDGCEHKFNRDKAKFCPECGCKSWFEPENCEEDYSEACEKLGLKLYNYDKWILGCGLTGTAEEAIASIAAVDKVFKELIPNIKPKVIHGEYAC
jgi:hypothetical protein